MREGLHGLIGRLRLPGTALIVEDVCVPPERIAEGARDLQALLGEHGFLPGVAGHASAGNLHFMLTPDFAKREDLERYEAFMAGLVELIVDKYDGSLKAEHGTGINMAPYVEREWGEKATELMWRVKRLADPDGVLSPGVVLNRDPGVHLRNLKTTPPIEESATTCVECGFCEPVCPSRNLTTTPRQRIVLRREMARQPAGSPLQRALLEEFSYEALDTCAADGSCQLACPVGIDTGRLVKELRARSGTPSEPKRWRCAAARRWGAVEAASRAGLRVGGPLARRTRRGKALPPPAPGEAARDVTRGRRGRLRPLLHQPDLRQLGVRRRSLQGRWSRSRAAPACRSGSPTMWRAAAAACRGARRGSATPTATRRTRWSSGSGLERGGRAADRRRRRLLHPRRSPIPARASLTEANAERLGGAGDPRLGRLGARPPAAEAGGPSQGRPRRRPPDLRDPAHGPRARLESLAGALAEEVYVPPSATCCGFAGDRGISHPELTEAATRDQAAELAGRRFDAHLSSNRTCEIGLSRATGAPYESFVLLLERLTRSG